MRRLGAGLWICIPIVLFACSGKSPTTAKTDKGGVEKPATAIAGRIGIGRFTEATIDTPLDEKKAAIGEQIFHVKCSSCHQLDAQKLLGPGLKNVTKRRSPAWIMNFITNTEEMLNSDPQAMKDLETYLVRMPYQNVSDEDARNLYEFMRKNDDTQ